MEKRSEPLLRQIIFAKKGQIEEARRNRYRGWEERVKLMEAVISEAQSELQAVIEERNAATISAVQNQPRGDMRWRLQEQQQQTGVILPKPVD